MNQVSALLKAGREKKGLSQEQVGEILGISQEGYGLYERGKREPSLDTLKRLIKLFEIEQEFAALFLEQNVVSRETLDGVAQVPVNLLPTLLDFRERLLRIESILKKRGDMDIDPIGE